MLPTLPALPYRCEKLLEYLFLITGTPPPPAAAASSLAPPKLDEDEDDVGNGGDFILAPPRLDGGVGPSCCANPLTPIPIGDGGTLLLPPAPAPVPGPTAATDAALSLSLKLPIPLVLAGLPPTPTPAPIPESVLLLNGLIAIAPTAPPSLAATRTGTGAPGRLRPPAAAPSAPNELVLFRMCDEDDDAELDSFRLPLLSARTCAGIGDPLIPPICPGDAFDVVRERMPMPRGGRGTVCDGGDRDGGRGYADDVVRERAMPIGGRGTFLDGGDLDGGRG